MGLGTRHTSFVQRWLFMLLLLWPFWLAHAQGAGLGYVEQVRVDPVRHVLSVSGSAAPARPSVFTTQLILRLDGREIYRGRFDRVDRPDVVRVTGRADWMQSGFSQTVSLPRQAPVESARLQALMRLGSGEEVELVIPAEQARVTWSVDPGPGTWRLVALWLAFTGPVMVWLLCVWPGVGHRLDRSVALSALRARGQQWLALSVGLSFVMLVGAGWSGSSIGLALEAAPMIKADPVRWSGDDRPVRSDEWEVLTPMLLSQHAHEPPFPVHNTLQGAEGHNMLVVGMTGVPVAHISSLAKPANWGFWLGDLRQALAWHWWWPWFAGFLALWQLLVRMLRVPWAMAALLSLLTVASPYAVVYSGWPAQVIAFAMAAVLGCWELLRAQQRWQGLLWGALAAWAACGFVLTLYPPWLISVGYVSLALLLGCLWQRRAEWSWTLVQSLGAFSFFAVIAGLLGPWWVDAREAVDAIRQTLYPGQRMTEVGGDVDVWLALKGWLTPFTLHDPQSPMISADAGSFALFLPVVALWGVWQVWRRPQQYGLAVGLLLCFLWIAYFVHVGLPAGLARWTLWGSATSYRMDLALGLLQTLMLGALWHAFARVERSRKTMAFVMSAAFAVLLGWMHWRMPPQMASALPEAWVVLSMTLAGAVSALWAMGHARAAVSLLAVWTVVPALLYNPLHVAPSQVSWSSASIPPTTPVAVAGHRTWAVMLPAAGVPVMNPVFYYPPQHLWARLDPSGKDRMAHQRYQRLLLQLAPVELPPYYRISSPRLDETRITLDPALSDFGLLGAGWLAADRADQQRLMGNSSLEFHRVDGLVVWFKVQSPAGKAGGG